MSAGRARRPGTRRRGGAPPGAEAGFTLLEVLVALTILSLAVVAAIQGFAQGLRLLKLSGDHQQAMMLADLKARELVTPEEEREEGTEGEFRWERTAKVIEAPDLTPVGAPPRWRVYEIVVRVRWEDRRQVELTTLRTVPIVQTAAQSPSGAQTPGTTPGTTTPGITTPGTTTPTAPPTLGGPMRSTSPRSFGAPPGRPPAMRSVPP
jgi:type II secretion system protein I